MAADLLVDTDVLVDHLRGARRFEPGTRAIAYSVITRCELFAGRSADEDRIGLLLGPFQELAIDREVAEAAGRLRRSGGIRTPDALIAATALVHGLALLTRNRRDFAGIAALDLADASR